MKSYVLLTLFQTVRYGIEQEDIKVEDFIGDAKLTYLTNLSIFKRQLQELLVVYSFQIPLKDFIKAYEQRYARGLDLSLFGVDSLEALFGKVIIVFALLDKFLFIGYSFR